MPTPMTNYTTYDLAYYYADLKQLPHLSREERQHLITIASIAPTTAAPASAAVSQGATQLKQRLIEDYLPFAKHLAITLCPSALYQRLLPELIGAVNLAVVEAIMRCDLESIGNLHAYVSAYVRGAIKRTLANDYLLALPWQVKAQARAEGTLEQLYAHYRVASLDECMQWFQTDEVEEPLVQPLLPTEAAPQRDPEQRAQVEMYLSYLSPRAQAILRLRYGLAQDNERNHSTHEIVCLLGIDRRVVLSTERDALTRLRALVEGQATLGRKKGKPCICCPDIHDQTYRLTPEQEAALLHAYTTLQAQGVLVTGRLLAQESGVGVGRALLFLRQQRSETPKEARARHRHEQLERAWARLNAQGVAITARSLAKEAGVGKRAMLDFLTAKRRECSHAAAS